MNTITIKQKLLEQRLLLLQHFIKLNAWCGGSKNTEGSEIARKALLDFDNTYSKFLFNENNEQ